MTSEKSAPMAAPRIPAHGRAWAGSWMTIAKAAIATRPPPPSHARREPIRSASDAIGRVRKSDARWKIARSAAASAGVFPRST
jgi:hypothetical protein